MITGLNEEEYTEVCSILKDYSQDYYFYFYGSRVKGNFAKFSDLDVYVVAINGGDYGILDQLQDIFDDNLKVLCKVNFTRDDYIDSDFRTRIKSYAIPYDWPSAKLGEILKLNYGNTLIKGQRIKGDIPVYGSNAVIGYHKEFQNTYNIFLNLDNNDKYADNKGFMKQALQDSLIVNFAKNYTISKNIIYKILFEEMGLEKHKDLRTINLILKSAYNHGLIENLESWVKYKDLRNIIAEKVRLKDELEALDYVESFLKDQEILIKNIDELLEQNAI